MTASRNTDRSFAGWWRIVETEVWDTDALDLVQPAFVHFDDECMGSFGMIAIEAGIDCRFGSRDGRPLVEFTFEGDDDGHSCIGRAWATIEPDGKLQGRLFIHRGDDSEFVAERAAAPPPPATRPRRPRRGKSTPRR